MAKTYSLHCHAVTTLTVTIAITSRELNQALSMHNQHVQLDPNILLILLLKIEGELTVNQSVMN